MSADNEGTGEYGPGVDQDTGANVGDTGTPELKSATADPEIELGAPGGDDSTVGTAPEGDKA